MRQKAPAGELYGFRLVVDALGALGDDKRHEGARIVEHQFAHQLIGALAHTENVQKPARFEFRDGLGADHAAVGDDADATDGEALAEPIHYRNEAAGIRCVAGPHLGADRPAIAVQEHGKDHLAQVRPMILGIAVPTERLASRALEIQTGRIHEHEIELGEQITPLLEQALFDDVLETARCKRGAPILFSRRQFLAEPSHRPIEMMQLEILDTINLVILTPPISCPVGSAGKQAMQSCQTTGEEIRAIAIEMIVRGENLLRGRVGVVGRRHGDFAGLWMTHRIERCRAAAREKKDRSRD